MRIVRYCVRNPGLIDPSFCCRKNLRQFCLVIRLVSGAFEHIAETRKIFNLSFGLDCRKNWHPIFFCEGFGKIALCLHRLRRRRFNLRDLIRLNRCHATRPSEIRRILDDAAGIHAERSGDYDVTLVLAVVLGSNDSPNRKTQRLWNWRAVLRQLALVRALPFLRCLRVRCRRRGYWLRRRRSGCYFRLLQSQIRIGFLHRGHALGFFILGFTLLRWFWFVICVNGCAFLNRLWEFF